MNDFIWRAELSCEAWPILKVSNHQTGRDTTHIFWTYRTDKTCSFWTEMTIYEHGKHITTPIGPGLIFCTYRTKKPIRCGLDWPYKVIRDRKFCFWKSLFILDWDDHIWTWNTHLVFEKTCSFCTEMTIYGRGTHKATHWKRLSPLQKTRTVHIYRGSATRGSRAACGSLAPP